MVTERKGSMGSRGSSGHSRRRSGDHRPGMETSDGSSNSFNLGQESEPSPDERLEMMAKNGRFMSTSMAGGIIGRTRDSAETAELTVSQHQREELQVVPEAARHLERPSIEGIPPLQQSLEDLRRIPYEEYVQHSEDYLLDRSDRLDSSIRLDGSHRFERSSEMSRQDSVSRPSSMSVVSDVSYGDRPFHSMPVIALAQDSGSILPHLNTSHKSACSMTAGSKRMAEKRAHMIRSGAMMYNELSNEAKMAEDKALEFTRWGGRKDYSHHERKRMKKKAEKADVRNRSEKSNIDQFTGLGQDSVRSTIDIKGSHGFHDLWGFAFKQDHLQYEQLIKEDKDRELVASYCEEPFWKIIFHFKGTVLRVIIEDILFWLTLATYVSIRIRFRLEPSEDTSTTDYENLSANLVYVGGFLLFFLVFYVNQNHHRYFELHQDSMTMMGRVNDMATLVKAILPMERARRINRHMNAAHVAMYTGLSSTYEKDNFFDPLEARFALLTDEELYRVVEEIDVDNSGPKAAYEIITWIMCDIRDAQINSFIDTNEAMQLREQLLMFRSTIAKVFVTTTLPIPFFYVHFLSMLTAVYLPLFAVVVAFETGEVDEMNEQGIVVAELVSGLVVFLQALFVIGLRILGQQLSDPYGGDLIDLQIARYVNMILNGSNQILAAKRLQPPSVETELRLQLKMSSLGQAFEYDTDDEMVVQH